MSINVPLIIVLGGIVSCGAYLLMDRSLIKMLLGLMLVGNAVNILILVVSGNSGNPPIRGHDAGRAADADPLAQAMILTAIVIVMGVAAFVLALVYRLYVLNRDEGGTTTTSTTIPRDVKILGGSLETAGTATGATTRSPSPTPPPATFSTTRATRSRANSSRRCTASSLRPTSS